MTPDWTSALDRADRYAPYLSRSMALLPDLVALLAARQADAALAWARVAGEGAPDVATALRREKRALALALAIGDLAGAFPLLRVTGALSGFADRALDGALADALRHRVPDAEPAGMIALALGKQGAGELNFSSDIDPILLYDPATLPRRARDDPGESANRIVRTAVTTLATVAAEGYVFRVDLRLRPAAEISGLAVPVAVALLHYESAALAWERAAFIRARACAGDVAAGEAFLAAIRPFVWRRSLDFGALTEIGGLIARIRATTRIGVPGPGFDLKRGRGGIREVEFFAQALQLIHGGRDPALRVRGTRAALNALAAAGLIDGDDARVLGQSYDRLRTLEHRLQMTSDQQTHALPQQPAAIDAVARLDGLESGAALVAEVAAITAAVAARFDALVERQPGARPRRMATLDAIGDQAVALGFADPDALAARVSAWSTGGARAMRSEAARAAFAAILPDLLGAFAVAPDPTRAITRFEQLLANLPSAVNLFRLLEARPGLIAVLGRVLSLAPPLADALARRADLLDPLIDARAYRLPGSVAELAARFAAGEPGDDYQRLLDRVRRDVGEARFVLGVQLIEAASDPLAISAALARVAQAALEVLAGAAVAEFQAAHGRVPGSELAILGLGRMGGGALTHASDLDLVFVFTGDFQAESDGRRPLGATLYHNRLAQRIIAALSVPTAQGPLYEIDTRLRPSGEQGPIAVSLESFARYQREQAWTWEHMALTRARPLFGSTAARAALATVVRDVLAQPREPGTLRQEVLAMRARMAEHKPAKSPLDVKLARGGLVDLEFLTHFVQLRDGGGLVPDLRAAIRFLADEGRLPAALVAAHDTLARALVAARLLAPDALAPSPAAQAALATACGSGDWPGFVAGIAEARQSVAAAWATLLDEPLETQMMEIRP